jgi:inorganic pyrophosphatase
MTAEDFFSKSFWEKLHRLIDGSKMIIDRPCGSTHPRFPDFIYPLDYGYMEATQSSDGGGIDVWVGSQADRALTCIIVTVDLTKRDSEIKILLGCSDMDIQTILAVHNQNTMGGIFIPAPGRSIP